MCRLQKKAFGMHFNMKQALVLFQICFNEKLKKMTPNFLSLLTPRKEGPYKGQSKWHNEYKTWFLKGLCTQTFSSVHYIVRSED